MPAYPDVPLAPGVPAVPRDPLATSTGTAPATVDDGSVVVVTGFHDKWGIFTAAGASVIEADSSVRFGYGKESDIPTYPIEGGELESYNKVRQPFAGSLVLSRTGTNAQRKTFMDALDDLIDATTLYTIVTPEKIYPSVSFLRVEYDRSAEQGASMIIAELRYRQARATVATTFTTTAAPSGADVRDAGNVQPQEPTAPERNIIVEGWE